MQYFIIIGDWTYRSPYTGKTETIPMMTWMGKDWTEIRSKAKQYKSRKTAEAAVERLKKSTSQFAKAKNISVEEVITVNS